MATDSVNGSTPDIGSDHLTSPASSTNPDRIDDTPQSQSQPQPPPSLPSSAARGMSSSSSPLGNINAARRPGAPLQTLSSKGLPPDFEARLKAFHLGRQGTPTGAPNGPVTPGSPGGIHGNMRLPPNMNGGPVGAFSGSQTVKSQQSSLAQKRGIVLPGQLPGGPVPSSAGSKRKPPMTLSQMSSFAQPGQGPVEATGSKSAMDKYSDFIDTKTGSLRFKGKATLTNRGIEFAGGQTFNISLDEVDTLDELGKGNYGTVYKVRHSRPRMRRPGLGLAGNKALTGHASSNEEGGDAQTSGAVMAMKEIRLELEDAKFAAIIMELDILHRCVSPYIVDFYGAFFQEGAVYICMEFMDGGSIDKLYAGGIPESVLQKIAVATVMGLKCLKDDHDIIHRDVKPTNILVNTHGQIKICDFGVSGNLVASIAKTNIGCQSYMAPERISSGGVAQAGANPGGGTYSVQSDIWSLGLTIIECALGQYPYPPETYDNIFSQLSAIVDGEPPDLPADRFSEAARNFVSGCLMKIPKLRPTYAMLLQHAWLAPLVKPPTIMEEEEPEAGKDMSDSIKSLSLQSRDQEVAAWVAGAIERRRMNKGTSKKATPALHAAPLDAVPSPKAV